MEVEAIWDALLSSMRTRISATDVDVWLGKARLTGHTRSAGNAPDRLLVEVANRYYADWIAENYQEHLVQIASNLLACPVAIDFTYQEEGAAKKTPVFAPTTAPTSSDAPRSFGLNTRQTFESFVVGECNRFAHAAAAAVADRPAESYNPLFIYGATGLGKTHLMHAIGNAVLAQHPSSRVVYVTAEEFTNDMINGIRYKNMDAFHGKYRRRATVLLVDDIQFLAKKQRTQEEFFHTFNALQSAGRQIVLTADLDPREIDGLEPRLRTRFEGGLLADMHAPDEETLTAILRQKADQLRLHIPDDLSEVIVQNVAGNVRELEGVVNRLSALQTFYSEPLTLEFAQRQLPKVFNPEPPRITVSTILEAVARFHNLRQADLTGGKRTRTLTRPRHIAMYLARVHTSLSFPELGREFGGRDHSTIQHGYRKVKRELPKDADLAYKIRLIEQALRRNA